MAKENPSYFEWLQLIVTFSIPVAIAVYTVLQNNRNIDIASYNRAQDLDIADDLEKDSILHECQKTLSKLIEKYGIRLNGTRSASLVARFTTLTAINQLDSIRRSFLIHLLYEARLINYQSSDDCTAISLESANLTDIDLTSLSHSLLLKYVTFVGAIMTRAKFRGMTLHGIRFDRAILVNADFCSTSNIWACDNELCDMHYKHGLNFENAQLQSSSFAHASYERGSFQEASMIAANFYSFLCMNCIFMSSNMTFTDLSSADIERSSFAFADLTAANFYGSNIGPNVDFDNANMKFVTAVKIKMILNKLWKTDISHATFDYAVISNSTFVEAKMVNISMKHSEITHVNFSDVNLFEANWQYVRCKKCFFKSVNFTKTDLSNAVFEDSYFQYTYLNEIQLGEAIFLNSTIILKNETDHS